jgi:uncharacterized membrane protein YeaQ/YmgE (transglycosylase-associated protein family)
MDSFLGWVIIGFIAGSVSGWFVGDRTARGCLPTIIVGMVGGVVGGVLAREMGLGVGPGLISSLVVAIIGSALVRLVLKALESNR